jgi:DNA-binding MarR family transcriptional regulator
MSTAKSPRKSPAPADSRRLGERLNSACIHVLRLVRHVDEDSGVSPPLLSVLSVLVFGGAKTLGELAAIEQVRPPSMTRIVQELESRGLVRRKQDKDDRRVNHVEATAAGVKMLHEGRSRRANLLAAWIAVLSESDARNLAAGLDAMEAIVQHGRAVHASRNT